jgi:tetratricopeptide (TPR) repeat protein
MKTLTAEQHFILAQVYDSVDNVAGMRKSMLAALAESPNPYYLATYARILLRRADLVNATIIINRLKDLDPHTFEPVALSVELLARQGEPGRVQEPLAKAVKLVLEYVDDADSEPKELATRQRLAALLLDVLSRTVPSRAEFVPAAEKLYRQWMKESKEPKSQLVLADFLGSHDRTAEAFSLCEKALENNPPDLVIYTSLLVLESTPANDPRLGTVEKWLQAAISQKPDQNVVLTGLLAILRERQGRFADAKDLYRKVIQKDSGNAVAFNNLAYLLALEGDSSGEALALAKQALAITGPTGAGLDTQAKAYLVQGKHDQAVLDLKAALAEAPTATRYYHLALALQRGAQQDEAKKALKEAKDRGLQANRLHLLERDSCAKMLVEPASK